MAEPESHQENDFLIARLESGTTEKEINAKGISIKRDTGNTGAISDLFDKRILLLLEESFANGYNNSLTEKEFKLLISEYIPLELVEIIYRAIDVNDIGLIQYADFTNYLISSEAGNSFSSRMYGSRLIMDKQQSNQDEMHTELVDCINYAGKPWNMIISGGRDGQILLWDQNDLRLIKNVTHKDKNTVFKEEQHKSRQLIKGQVRLPVSTKTQKSHKNNAITAMYTMIHSGLLCIGSADCSLTIYELGTQDVCGRFTELGNVPTCLDYFVLKNPSGYNIESLNQQYLAIGDARGYLHLIRLHPEFGASTEVGMKKKNQILFTQSTQNHYSKVSIHNDWITKIRYISELNSLVTSSTDGSIHFVDVAKRTITKTFTGHINSKIGVKTFSWSGFGKFIVSASDRVMIFWDPNTLDISMKIDSFRSPLVDIEVFDKLDKIIAVSANKTIFIWHNINYELLQSLTDPTVYLPSDTYSSMIFAPEIQKLFTASNCITSWRLERASEEAAADDDEDLVAALYNPLFHQVMMVKSLGLVKIYQAQTGEIVRQFSAIPIDNRTRKPVAMKIDKDTGLVLPIIKHACLDEHKSRLIVTGHDNSVQFWSFSDGSNLIDLQPQFYSNTLAQQFNNLPKAISCVGYEILNKLSRIGARKYLLIGTEQGNLCGYEETNAVIEAVPVFFFRVKDNDLNLSSNNKKDGHSIPSESNNESASSDVAVLWMELISNSSQLVIGYLSGQVSIWDLDRNAKVKDLSINETGPILVGMRSKFAPKNVAIANTVPDSTNNVNAIGSHHHRVHNNANSSNAHKHSTSHLDKRHHSSKLVPKNDVTITESIEEEINNANINKDSIPLRLQKLQQENPSLTPRQVYNLYQQIQQQQQQSKSNSRQSSTRPVNPSMQQTHSGQNSPSRTPAYKKMFPDNNDNEDKIKSKPSSPQSNQLSPVTPSKHDTLSDESKSRITSPEKAPQSPSSSYRPSDSNNPQLTPRSPSSNQNHSSPLSPRNLALAAVVAELQLSSSAQNSQSVTVDLPSIREEDNDDGHPAKESSLLNLSISDAGGGLLNEGSSIELTEIQDFKPSSRVSRSTLLLKNSQHGHNHKRRGQKNSLSLHGAATAIATILASSNKNNHSAHKSSLFKQKNNIQDSGDNADEQNQDIPQTSTSPGLAELHHIEAPVDASKVLGNDQIKDNHSVHNSDHKNNMIGEEGNKYHTDKTQQNGTADLNKSFPGRKTIESDANNNLQNNMSSQVINQTIHTGMAYQAKASRFNNSKTSIRTTVAYNPQVKYGVVSVIDAELKEKATILHAPLPPPTASNTNNSSQIRSQSINNDDHPSRATSKQSAIGSGSEINGISSSINTQHITYEKKENSLQAPHYHRRKTTSSNNEESKYFNGADDAEDSLDSSLDDDDAGNDLDGINSSVELDEGTHSGILDSHSEVTVAQKKYRRERGKNPSKGTKKSIIVDCIILLTKAKIIIGACSDKYLRFWDGENKYIVLCSCLYYHRAELVENVANSALHPSLLQHADHSHSSAANHHQYGTGLGHGATGHHRPKHNNVSETTKQSEETLNVLKLNESETIMIGGYDSGMIRIWSFQYYSISTLRNLLVKHLASMNNVPSGATQGMFDPKKQSTNNNNTSPQKGNNNSNNSNGFGLGFGFGLSISPIMLLSEWQAQLSPIVSVHYIHFDYNHKNDEVAEKAHQALSIPNRHTMAIVDQHQHHQQPSSLANGSNKELGFVLSAGLDQRVLLWTTQGRCVGEFGSYGWDINDESTWKRKGDISMLLLTSSMDEMQVGNSNNHNKRRKQKLSYNNGGFLGSNTPRPPSSIKPSRLNTNASSITKETVNLMVSPSTVFLQNIGKRKVHSTSEMAKYVETLSEKILARPAAYEDVSREFHSIM
eukprot:gene10466-14060_t